MRRSALSALSLVVAGLVSGCTGTGLFFDHTFQWFGGNPNTPAGSSEMFLRLRGQPVDIVPLLPEKGNVWPDNSIPDKTLQDLQKQQAEEIRRNGGQSPTVGTLPPADGAQPVPPAIRQRQPRPQPQPGQSLDTNLQNREPGYRQLQQAPDGAAKSVLVPNGNGTSTLIGPDGSVQTVPTKP